MGHRTSILLISVLKPVNDTRIYEKFGLSLGQTNKYDVNIIGFKAKNVKKIENIRFYPIFNFNRLSLARFLAPLNLFRHILKVKPSIIIYNTPEIQNVILLYKLLYGCKIIYDIQENYYRNIKFNKNYPGIFRSLIAEGVRLKEISGRVFIDKVIFAEEGYKKEMPGWNKKAVVIKNTYARVYGTDSSMVNNSKDILKPKGKYKPRSAENFKEKVNSIYKANIKIIYTGTIAENYGIYTAIEFIDDLHNRYPSISLVIAGYAANQKTLAKVLRLIDGKDYIELIGGSYMLPHENIIRLIRNADFGLICYQINPSTENCFPTKIYEYMANKLPVIIQDYKPWSSFCLKHNAAIEVDFEEINYDQLYSILLNSTFYKKNLPEEIYWHHDEKKLLDLIEQIRA